MIHFLVELTLIGIVRLCSGIIIRTGDKTFMARPVIYYANHTSHLDLIAILSAFPYSVRRHIHPVAALDYWDKGLIRKYIAKNVLRCVLLDRFHPAKVRSSLESINALLQSGESVLIFPEGTRNPDGNIGEFQGGLYLMSKMNPDVPLIPVRLRGLHKTLPKGEWLPAPNMSEINFGRAVFFDKKEPREKLIERCRNYLTGEEI